ncbi:hypothetical protein P692DRAFT_20881094 [Suillus brevipes Sb2]|nr:hypothetical protein P692DRAFT_20881094 [Suillus brevipes Sb2]
MSNWVKKQRLELRDSTRAWNSVLVPFRRVFHGRQSSDGTDNFRLSPAVNAVTLSGVNGGEPEADAGLVDQLAVINDYNRDPMTSVQSDGVVKSEGLRAEKLSTPEDRADQRTTADALCRTEDLDSIARVIVERTYQPTTADSRGRAKDSDPTDWVILGYLSEELLSLSRSEHRHFVEISVILLSFSIASILGFVLKGQQVGQNTHALLSESRSTNLMNFRTSTSELRIRQSCCMSSTRFPSQLQWKKTKSTTTGDKEDAKAAPSSRTSG